MYDERMLHFLSRLSETHVDPSVSDPKKLDSIPDDALSEGEERPNWRKDDLEENSGWGGLFKDVGIFTDDQWNHLMCKCLASMGMEVASHSLSFTYILPLIRNPAQGCWVLDHRSFGR